MKKLYTLLFIALAGAMSAQLTQANHAPAAGDTYTLIGVDATGITPGAAGSGVLWDFTSAATVNSVVMNYTAASSINANYPSANVVSGYSGSNQSYLKSSSSSLLYYGGNIQVQSVSGSLNYASPAIWGVYPMGLNTASTSATSGTINTSVGNGTFVGNSTVTVDGTGTLALSTGTFVNVMRTKTTQTMDVSLGFLTGKLYQDVFEYYGTLKSPLFTIMSATVSVGQTLTQVIAARNKDAVNTVTTSVRGQNSEQLRVYPQPAGAEVTFAGLSAKAVSIEVCDITGKIVATQAISAEAATLPTSALPQGIYIYSVKDSEKNNLLTGKFTVVH